MRTIAKHLVLSENAPFAKVEGLTVYACQFEDGTPVTRGSSHTVGNGTVILFPCQSCEAEISSQIIEPLLKDAAKEAIIKKRQQEARTIVYRGVALVPLPDYEVPEPNSSEWRAVEREIDKYLDEGKPMRLVGFDVFFRKDM